MEPHSVREMMGGFVGGPSAVCGGSVIGVEVGVGVDVGVLVGVGGGGVEVGGTGVGEGVAVGVGVGMWWGVGDGGNEVIVSAPEPCTAAGRGRESLTSRATKTPATRLRMGTSIQLFPTARLLMLCHHYHRRPAILLCDGRRE
jgi:hypothetical protein